MSAPEVDDMSANAAPDSAESASDCSVTVGNPILQELELNRGAHTPVLQTKPMYPSRDISTSTQSSYSAEPERPSDTTNAIRNAITALSKVEHLLTHAAIPSSVEGSEHLRRAKHVLAGLDREKTGAIGRRADASGTRSTTEEDHTRPEQREAATEEFMKRYCEDLDDWRSLVEFVKDACEQGLQSRGVQARISARVKEVNSLRAKLKKRQDAGSCQGLEAMEQEPWDIAGVRICLYIPSDTSKVRDLISSHKNFRIIPQRPYRYLPFREPPLVGSDYLFKPFREHSHRPANAETRPYEERMGYYDADHYWIEPQGEDVLDQNPAWRDKKVEIQVRSVVMDAWAEVRHDLDYKNVLQGFPGEDELRTLDAIKGNVATCEILLDNLRKLQDDRITADQVEFSFPEHFYKLGSFPHAILQTLRIKHRQLLDLFPFEEVTACSRYNIRALGRLMEAFGITTPTELRDAIIDLKSQEVIEEYLIKAQSCFSDREDQPYYRNSPNYPRTKGLGLFEFLFAYLLLKPVDHAKWNMKASYQLGLNMLRALEQRMFWDLFPGRGPSNVEKWDKGRVTIKDIPINATYPQVEAFSTIWYVRACIEPGGARDDFERRPLLASLSIGNLSFPQGPLPDWWQSCRFDPLYCIFMLSQNHLIESIVGRSLDAAGGIFSTDTPRYGLF